MNHVMITILDRAAGAYSRPSFYAATGQAIRQFQDEINRADKDNVLFAHPDDFDLYELGSFDDNTGAFKLLDKPRQIAIGKQLKTGAQQ
ncbi:MAG: nonstructural protein [Microviridae sp.]|nr:MAG: nonstructural protein [Microviridae sp.]